MQTESGRSREKCFVSGADSGPYYCFISCSVNLWELCLTLELRLNFLETMKHETAAHLQRCIILETVIIQNMNWDLAGILKSF